MHVSSYDPDKAKIPESITALFAERSMEVPKLIFFGVEDSVMGIYKFENGMELLDGPAWCDKHNREVFDKFAKGDNA